MAAWVVHVITTTLKKRFVSLVPCLFGKFLWPLPLACTLDWKESKFLWSIEQQVKSFQPDTNHLPVNCPFDTSAGQSNYYCSRLEHAH